ncbi:MAG: DUF2490 domain-containing protein [Deltaproteobacteria bacterium]|nr:DUF2490 domain-containing protein [Deltaproteobacteria bacterium]
MLKAICRRPVACSLVIISILLSFGFSKTTQAAQVDSGMWINPKVSKSLGNDWSLGAAAEVRTFHDFKSWNQFLFHLYAKKNLTKNLSLLAGVSYMGTLRQTMIDEYRPWQAIALKLPCDFATFTLQEKLEERFYPGYTQEFALRSRSLFAIEKDLGFTDVAKFVASDEFFVSFNNTDWGSQRPLDQNRIKVGLKFPKLAPFDFVVSYQNQHLFRKNAADLNVNLIVLEAGLKL